MYRTQFKGMPAGLLRQGKTSLLQQRRNILLHPFSGLSRPAPELDAEVIRGVCIRLIFNGAVHSHGAGSDADRQEEH